jgi:hypothetical protein
MIFKNESQFVIFNTLIILDCIWNLEGITNEDEKIHFTLTSGVFKCERTTISSFINDNLRFLNCTNINNNLNISHLSFKNIVINSDGYHFTLRGDTNISDSV